MTSASLNTSFPAWGLMIGGKDFRSGTASVKRQLLELLDERSSKAFIAAVAVFTNPSMSATLWALCLNFEQRLFRASSRSVT